MTRPISLLLVLIVPAIASCSRGSSDSANIPASYPSPYVAVARGRVDVEDGLLNIAMPVEGILAEVDVHEGDRVKQGQVLAIADTTSARVQVDIAQARLEQARVLERQLESRIAPAKLRAQRLQQAAAAGAGDGQSADDARDAVSQLDSDLAGARATVNMARAEAEQARYLLDRQTLHAPVDAQVLKVAVQKGMSVSPQGGAVFTLLPMRPYIIRAELNETFVSAVRAGMSAQVSNDDGSTPSGTAHVLRVGSVYGPATLQDDANARTGERSVECVLALDGTPALRVGQKVLVRFLPGSR
jgi:multidrug resistance efflux pump